MKMQPLCLSPIWMLHTHTLRCRTPIFTDLPETHFKVLRKNGPWFPIVHLHNHLINTCFGVRMCFNPLCRSFFFGEFEYSIDNSSDYFECNSEYQIVCIITDDGLDIKHIWDSERIYTFTAWWIKFVFDAFNWDRM